MLYKSLSDLTDAADRVYRDPGWQALRRKQDQIESLVHSTNPVEVPEGLANRVREVHTGVAMEKVLRGMTLISAKRGPSVEVERVGTSQKAELLRERLRAWLISFKHHVERRRAGSTILDPYVRWGIVVHSRHAIRVQPFQAAWVGLCADKPKRKQIDLDDVRTIDEIEQRVNEFMAEAMGAEITDDGDDENRRAAIRRRRVPIQVTSVPSECVWWDTDDYGVSEVWEYRQATVREVLLNYRDRQGKPLAQDLAREWNAHVEDGVLVFSGHDRPTASDVVTLVIRSDRKHMQVFTADFMLDQAESDPPYRQPSGNSCLLWEGEHGLDDRVPYAIFEGRVTGAKDAAKHYCGLLDPGYDSLFELDHDATRAASIANFVAWPQLYVKKGDKAAGVGDRPADMPIAEATVLESTGPDESLEVVPWSTREGLDWVRETTAQKRGDIDRQTFGASAYGSTNVDSGYLQGELVSAATSTMDPYREGLEVGWEDFFDLVLKTGRALHRQGLGAIPIRNVLPEGKEWEELTPEMTEVDWAIRCSVEPDHPAGKMAQYQAIAFKEDRGWTTKEDAIRESGNPYPLQVMEQRQVEVLEEELVKQGTLLQLVQAQLFAAVQQRQLGGMPAQPLLPPAAAGALSAFAGDPSLGALGARLPQLQPGQQFGIPGVSNPMALPAGQPGGIGGGPNFFAQNPAPPPPTPRAETVNKGGGVFGAAVGSPGGLPLQDQLNGLRR